MSNEEIYIFEASQNNFNTSVILNSHKLPVLVLFQGVWSEHCLVLADTITAFAKEFAGQIVFAKVDIDEQPELRQEYRIENVPTLKVFKNGEVVRTEQGLMGEDEIRALLKDFGVFRKSDALREQARQQHMSGDSVTAVKLLTEAIQKDPGNVRVVMDMVQVMLDMGELAQAEALLNRLPEQVKTGDTGQALSGQLTFKKLAAKTAGKQNLLDNITNNPADFDSHFDLSVCLVAEHDYKQAMEHLFTIFDKEPDYKEGAAKELIIALTNMLAPNDPQLAQEFRRRLGSSLA